MNLTFEPTAFFRNPHVQTIFSAAFLPAPKLREAQRIWIPIESGVCLESRFDGVPQPKGAVVLLHGLGGSSESRIVRSMAGALLGAGYDTFRVSLRGFEQGSCFPTMFHFGKTEDLTRVAQYIRRRGYTRVFFVGVSLGGAFLLNWLRKEPGNVTASVVISPPMDLLETVEKIDQPKNRFYRTFFLRQLFRILLRKIRRFPETFSQVTLSRGLGLISAYESSTTVPFYRLKDLSTYYGENSFRGRWDEISSPTLVIHSTDDPILGSMSPFLPKSNGTIQTLLFPHGGHVGFYDGLFRPGLVQRSVGLYFDHICA